MYMVTVDVAAWNGIEDADYLVAWASYRFSHRANTAT
jgi:hypothetical protein